MLGKLRPRSIYDVMAAIACVVALMGGTAYAANTIRTGDIVDNEVFTTDVRDDTLGFGGLTHSDLGPASVRGSEVQDGSLSSPDVSNGSLTGVDVATASLFGSDLVDNSVTGADVLESTLVGVTDQCHAGAALFGRLCAGSDGVNRDLLAAFNFCASIGLRLPTWGEGVLLAVNHDVPGVGAFPARFWTDEVTDVFQNPTIITVMAPDENGASPEAFSSAASFETVCVETPTDRP